MMSGLGFAIGKTDISFVSGSVYSVMAVALERYFNICKPFTRNWVSNSFLGYFHIISLLVRQVTQSSWFLFIRESMYQLIFLAKHSLD